MQPLGVKRYKDKYGGKHHVRVNGKFLAWWTDICTPNKRLDTRRYKKDIDSELQETHN